MGGAREAALAVGDLDEISAPGTDVEIDLTTPGEPVDPSGFAVEWQMATTG